jgi:hypothetical protein
LLDSLAVKLDRLYQQPTSLPSGETAVANEHIPRHVVFAALLVGLFTFALFAPTWSHRMLYWDDDENVLQNPLVVQPVVAGLRQIFTAPFSTDYYPLTYISLALDHFVWRGHFFGYHVTQTLLHGANAFLVVLLVWRWTGTIGVALLAGAWFAWHPVQVETVAWIAERKNVLGTFFFLLAWLAYLRGGNPRWRLASVGLFVLAVLSHALVIVMPVLLIAYELCLRRTSVPEVVRRTWLFFVPAALAALMRVFGHSESGQLVASFHSFGEGVLTMTKVVGEYLSSLVWPVGLSNHYTERGVTSLTDTGFLIGVAWIVAWMIAAGRSRWALFAGVWFVVALAPVLQVVPHPTLRADRYLYVAALGSFVLVALLLEKNRRLIAVVGPVSAICLAALTLARIPDWRDAKTLWSDCVRKNPRSAVGYYSLAGCAVMEKGWPAAEQFLRRTIELKPEFAEAHERLGGVYLMEGKKPEAREELERALVLNPQLSEARHNLMILEQHRE